jgi:4-amino-4-deoxy-L-arabinose transferase-like glycosyltransferase
VTGSRAFRRRLAAIALLGLALRVAWILLGDWSPDRQIGDAGFFHAVANLVGAGHGFSVPDNPAHPPTAGHPPLHVLVLSLPSALGLTGWTVHRMVGAVEGALTILLVGLLARRVGGERAGLIAALLAAVYPVFIRIDGSVLSEPLAGLLVTACLLAALRLIDRPGPRHALALGALIGLAALTRSETLLLLPLLALPAAVYAGGARARNAGLVALACVVLLVPWTVRNQVAFGRFVPLSSNSGTALSGANCDATYAGIDLGFWRFGCAHGPAPRGNEADQAAQLRSQGIHYARDHAGRLPVVMSVRVLRTWDLYQPLRQAKLSEGGHVKLAEAGVFSFYVLALLAIAGAFALRRRRAELLVLLAPVILVTVTAIATLGAPRLRFSAEVSIVVLAGVALASLTGRREPV